MGGFVAQEMLLAAPERVAGIALVNSAIDTDGPEHVALREKTIAAAERDFGRVCERIVDLALHPAHRGDAEIRRVMRSVMDPVGVRDFTNHNRAVMARRDLGHVLAASRAPLLVITAEADAVVEPARSRVVLGLRPDATECVIPDAGHMTVLENPQAVAAALNAWLAA
jgi:pimeloyl-ACP methyl ester carboxylesterase